MRSATLVSDLMSQDVIVVRPEETAETLLRLMGENDVRHLPVVDDGGRLVGLVSQRDLLRITSLRSLAEAPGDPHLAFAIRMEEPASSFMARDLRTTRTDASLGEAARLLVESGIGCLPVVDGDGLRGILTESDFVRAFLPSGS